MAVLLNEARAIIENQISRTITGVTTGPYTEKKADVAIKTILHEVNFRAKVLRSKGTFNTVADQATANFTTADTTFEQRRLLSLRIGLLSGTALYDTFTHKHLGYVTRLLEQNTGTGQPEFIGFEANSAALLHPIPDAVYRITYVWNEPETDFALGAAGDGVTFSMPEDVIYPALSLGGAAMFQTLDDARRNTTGTLWFQYRQWLEQLVGEYSDMGEDFAGPDGAW